MRFAQCIRRYLDTREKHHLVNVGKYTSAMIVTSLAIAQNSNSYYMPHWITVAVLGTLYSYSWDLKMDWSLLDREHGYLRSNLLLPKPFYYFAMVSNLFLRIAWVLTISPDTLGRFFVLYFLSFLFSLHVFIPILTTIPTSCNFHHVRWVWCLAPDYDSPFHSLSPPLYQQV